MGKRVMGVIWQILRRQEGMQTIEWILLLGLIGTILLGLMAWFGGQREMVGSTIWDFVKSWLDKAKGA